MSEIKITRNVGIKFPESDVPNGDLLLVGNLDGACGEFYKALDKGHLGKNINVDGNLDVLNTNIGVIDNFLKSGRKIHVISYKDTVTHFSRVAYWTINMRDGHSTKHALIKNKEKLKKLYEHHIIETKKEFNDVDFTFNKVNNMKFDTIIINPPFSGSLHLQFFEKALEHLDENGKMVIIEPARWTIDIFRDNSTYLTGLKNNNTPQIKKKIEGHVESIVIENLNIDFEIKNYIPFSITTIDMSKKFDKIKFTCFGEYKEVDSIFDCNLIGRYDLVSSIFNKVQKYKDMVKNHTTDVQLDNDDYWYVKYINVLKCHCGAYATKNYTPNKTYDRDIFEQYFYVAFDDRDGVQKNIHNAKDKGNKTIEDKTTGCIYGTKQELENWEHFIKNNKLSMFIIYTLVIDQHNYALDYLPWLVDKKYTDGEINELFEFSDEEVNLIESTYEKFKTSSVWFKRMMMGPNIDNNSDTDVKE